MATSIFFNGRLISVPGSYSEVDASGLEQVGLGAAGIVAVIGTAEGGIPVSEIEEPAEFIRITKPEQARETFRSGDLREVADMLFGPGRDPAILGGASELVAMKVNPATGSSATFANAQGNSMVLTSVDYGACTAQINVSNAAGTVQGKLLTITFEDSVESVDDLGGDAFFSLTYKDAGYGWDTMTGQVLATGILQCLGTRDEVGLDGDITAQGQGVVNIASASALDTDIQVLIAGVDASGNVAVEILTTDSADGTTTVTGTQVFGAGGVYGAQIISGAAGAGDITVKEAADTILTISAGNFLEGGVVGSGMYAAGALDAVADGATTQDVVLVGFDASGTRVAEKLTLAGAVAVNGAQVFSEIGFIALGHLEAARTVTLSGTALQSVPATQSTLQKLADYVNAKAVGTTAGFFMVLETGLTSLSPAELDIMPLAVSILNPAAPDFYADLYTMVAWINNNSVLVTAAKATGASGGMPANTTAPVFLTGGGEGTTTTAQWQTALNLLKRVRVNTVVPLTGDPAIHALAEAHCAYMGGIGRSERDCFVGVTNATFDDVPTKAEYKSAIVDLNSRHVRAFGQAIERYNTAGEREEFLPPFQAAVCAGMQAGSSVGTSLTHKYVNVLAIRQKNGTTGWNPTDDSEEMIQAGACFMENVDGVGRRVVRNITTHLTSNNLAFIEGSVNEAVNFAVFNFRQNMEFAVGKQGFSGTVNAAKGVAITTLGLLVDENVLVAYRSLDIELVVDVLQVSCEVAPVLPVNFVRNTIHLVTIRQTAA